MIENFIYAWTANQLSAAIRLIPMGSIKAQTIQLELLDLISEVSQEIVDSNINDLYVGNISLSMAQQNHNDLYTKLFRKKIGEKVLFILWLAHINLPQC